MTPQQRLALSSRNPNPTKKSLKRRTARQLVLESLEGRQLMATFVVNTFADIVDAGDGLTSLREAITQANALAGEDRIELSAGTYSLTRSAPNESNNAFGDLDVRDDLVIVGAGSGATTIDASTLATRDRIFEVLAFRLSSTKFTSFNLSGVTLTGGVANQLDSLTADRGGGIFLDRQVTAVVTDCHFIGNRAIFNSTLKKEGNGGAIYSEGTLTIDNSRFENNTATGVGGAIGINGSGTPTALIRNSTFTGNRAAFGGAIRHSQTLVVENSTFVGNIARHADGVRGQGGAIESTGGSLTLTNVTISGNDAISGGGVFTSATTNSRLNHVTIAFNTATYGGGWHTNAGAGIARIENTIVARNTAAQDSQGHDVANAVTSLGYNLIGTAVGSSGWVATDLLGVDPLLDVLAPNGGPTWTHALLNGSPAGDAANPSSSLTADQRGLLRPRDVNGDAIFRSDIGAFEVQVVWPPIVAAGGPYAVEEGSSVGLDANGSRSRQLNPALQFAWDFDLDGEFDDAAGATPTFSAAAYDGPATVTVMVRVTDSAGLSSDGAATIEVGNVAPTIDSVSLNPSANFIVGGPISLTALFSDPGTTDLHAATIDWGDNNSSEGQISESSGSGNATASHTYLNHGNYTIVVTLYDDDDGSDTASVTIFVAGPPTANAGGPYSVVEGGSVTLSGSGSSEQSDPTLTFAWDFDNDGQFDDAIVASPTFSASALNGNTSVAVRLRVTDSQGLTGVAAATVTVTNATPTIDSLVVVPPDIVNVGSPVDVTTAFSDNGLLDTHSVTVDWGDGTQTSASVNQTSGGGTANSQHAYSAPGVFTIVVTVTDDGGAFATATHLIEVTGSDLLVGGVLRLVGTQGDDAVNIHKLDDGSLYVQANFLPQGFAQFAPNAVKTIVIHLAAGNDNLFAANNVNIPMVADGGTGNDVMRGGGRRDILIGGDGLDWLVGANGDDLLIAGTTSYDASDDALLSVLAEWNSGNKYEVRVRNIRNGAGEFLSGKDIRLASGVTVFDDDDADRMSGGNGRDWFFYDPERDVITDRAKDELRNNDEPAAARRRKRR